MIFCLFVCFVTFLVFVVVFLLGLFVDVCLQVCVVTVALVSFVCLFVFFFVCLFVFFPTRKCSFHFNVGGSRVNL